ncbi:hypothetical protein [Stutzerimonas stutzeri]|uniref:hypothetical protein n=1 Tax=Stutzerimonas stutzeri TaxID=316 RepID=UPI001C2DFE01|nr:hypothetical protein [Stutzerimonas stutzeri]
MKSITTMTVLLASLVAQSVFAQSPAGTAEDEQGARPSPMGNPTPQQTLDTHKDSQGRTVIEDGKPVSPAPRTEGAPDTDVTDPSVQPDRHSSHGGPTDSASDPGELE